MEHEELMVGVEREFFPPPLESAVMSGEEGKIPTLDRQFVKSGLVESAGLVWWFVWK